MAFQLDITDNANTNDTVKAIIDTINTTSKEGYVPKLSKALNPTGNKLEFIKRLFDFICKNVEYEMDAPGWEKIYTPQKLFLEAKGDCKKMSTAIAAVLKSAGIEPLLKVISYDNKNWSHIYVIVVINKNIYILDPVNEKKFNEEIAHKKAAVFNLNGKFEIMNGTKLSILGRADSFSTGLDKLAGDLDAGSSVGCNDCRSINGTDYEDRQMIEDFKQDFLKYGDHSLLVQPGVNGWLKDAVSTVKEAVQTVGNKIETAVNTVVTAVKTGNANTILAAPVRGAFLALLGLGSALKNTPIKMHLGEKMAISWNKDNGAQLSAMWKKFGGDPQELKSMIAKSSGETLNGQNRMGFALATVAAVTAAIAAATPILVKTYDILKKDKTVKPETGEATGLINTIAAGGAALNPDGTPPKAGNILDFSTPLNTIIKALFLIIISSFIPGTLSILLITACTLAIIVSLKKLRYEIQL